MHAPAPEQRKDTWRDKFVRSGFFLGAVLFHLVLFLMVATWVIFDVPPPPPNAEFQAVNVKVPPPPPKPPSSGDAANNPQFEPQQVVVPVVTPPSVIATSMSSAFAVDTTKVIDQAMSHLAVQAPQGTGQTQGGGGTIGAGTSPFGNSDGTSPGLSGQLYDLKQTRDRTPTGIAHQKFYELLQKYVSEGWHEAMLDNYYKSHTVLQTDGFEIPAMNSQAAPKAFGVEKEVRPSWWIAHYHGQVEAPQSGEYRLAGYADNVIFVRIGGKNVLDGGINLISSDKSLQQHLPFSFGTSQFKQLDEYLKIGPAFHMEAGKPVNMDVLIGDDGGQCGFFLLVEKVGNTYEKAPDGTPKYPFFQLSPKAAPTFLPQQKVPPHSNTPEPWQLGGG